MPGPWSLEGVVESRDPRAGKRIAEAPRWVRPNPGAPSARAPGSVLSPRGDAAEVGDAAGRYGCHSVGHGLRNEASVDPRMVRIPRVEEEPVQVGKPRTRGRAECSSASPAPGAQGRRLGRRLRQRPHPRKHPWEGDSHLNARPSRDARGAPVTASAAHRPCPGPRSFCTQALE